MSILGIIPARFGSTRLPGKPLIKVKGKSIIQRVYERVAQAENVDEIIVATDDVRIYNHVKKFGGQAMSTRIDHKNGTMRCAEVIAARKGFDYVINIQGDEPLINPGEIDRLAAFVSKKGADAIATLVRKIDTVDDLESASVAKVVLDKTGRALYFSRTPIPHVRDVPREQWLENTTYYKHIGMYAYAASALHKMASLSSSPLEDAEVLEQLTWLYHGFAIYTIETEADSIGIDTPEDVALLEHLLSLAD